MPISQVIAADFSYLQSARATESIPVTGEGFNAYLARIMNPQTLHSNENSAIQPPDETYTYESVPPLQESVQPIAAGYESEPAQPHSPARNDTPVTETAPAATADAPPAKEKTMADTQSRDDTDGIKGAGEDPRKRPGSVAHARETGRSESAAKVKPGTDPKAVKVGVGSLPSGADRLVSGGVQGGTGDSDLSIKKAGITGVRVSDEVLSLDDRVSESNTVQIDVVLGGAEASAHPGLSGAAERGEARKGSGDDKNAKEPRVHNAISRAEGEDQPDDRGPAGHRARIEVKDFRRNNTGDSGPQGRSSDGAGKGQPLLSEQGAGPDSTSVPDSTAGGDSAASRGTVDFSSARGGQPVSHGRTSSEMMTSLRQTLSESLNAEVVRAARLVVRGNDTGEIRLNLKPDTLGNVRILLKMTEGHIAGRIIVENSSVREAFEQNLASLAKAFSESGLETGSIDVAVADSGSGNQEKSEDRDSRQAIRELDRAVPLVQMLEDDHELVDLVV